LTLPIPCPLSNSRYELALSCDWFGSPAESPKRPCYLTSQAGRRHRLNANAAAIREIASAVSQSPEWSKDAQNIAVDLWTRDKSNILTPWGLDTHHRSALHLCEHVTLEAQAAGFASSRDPRSGTCKSQVFCSNARVVSLCFPATPMPVQSSEDVTDDKRCQEGTNL